MTPTEKNPSTSTNPPITLLFQIIVSKMQPRLPHPHPTSVSLYLYILPPPIYPNCPPPTPETGVQWPRNNTLHFLMRPFNTHAPRTIVVVRPLYCPHFCHIGAVLLLQRRFNFRGTFIFNPSLFGILFFGFSFVAIALIGFTLLVPNFPADPHTGPAYSSTWPCRLHSELTSGFFCDCEQLQLTDIVVCCIDSLVYLSLFF